MVTYLRLPKLTSHILVRFISLNALVGVLPWYAVKIATPNVVNAQCKKSYVNRLHEPNDGYKL